MKNVFELLERKNLIKQNKINVDAINSLSPLKIVDLAESIVSEIEMPERTSKPSIFSHSVSMSLSGSRAFCSHIDHRRESLDELSRFALLYSDKVYIKNYFSEYDHYLQHDAEDLRQILLEDILLLYFIKPLLESKTISIFTPPKDICVHQWTEMSFGQDSVSRLRKEERRLEKEYLLHTEVQIQQFGDLYAFLCKGPERLFEHGNWATVRNPDQIPQSLLSMPRIMNRVHEGEKVTLSKSVKSKLNLHKHFAHDVANNISFDLSAAQLLNTTFLTNKMLHIEFLKSISIEPEIEQRNAIAQKYLTSIVPFVNDVELSKLVKLREREAEAFILYRQALNKAIDEFRNQDKIFTERDARSIYSDIIAPKLSSLEQKVKHAKKDLTTKAYRSIIAVTGAITFGIYTGFIPTELVAMAKVLGFTKIASDIIEKLLPLGDAAESIKAEEMYFLWQVKKQSSK